jgi:gamma-glutamylcyclotransferase (GGCT)/AIG2-like uncharacterized protein YtfP
VPFGANKIYIRENDSMKNMKLGRTKFYVSYGSNTNVVRMKQRCPKAKLIGTGILKDYKLTFRGVHKGVANIEPCQGTSLEIVLWEITEACERELDIYEGFPHLYTKETVEVIVDGKLINAMVYIMASQYTDMAASPMESYYATIAKGYEENNIDLKQLQTAYSECLSELEGRV